MSWSVDIRLRLGRFTLEVDLSGDAAPVAVVGPNGSGKTTLLRVMAGAHRPQAGRIELGGQVVFDAARGIDEPTEARRVGYVPQGYGLFPHLDVADNVAFGRLGRAGDRKASTRRAAAVALLDELECTHLADRHPRELSGGEQQRVALARALFIEPRILLLDEPLAALDASGRRAVRRYLADRLAARSGPALVVTHDVRDVRALGARVVALEAGRVVQSGAWTELAERPATEFVAELFEGSPRPS
jgi:ABC-type sulfate/molybdate transport systems ATPase subunit